MRTRYLPTPEGGGPRARVSLPAPVAPGEPMLVWSRAAAELAEAGPVLLPPEDRPAVEPLARLILVEQPRGRERIRISEEPQSRGDRADTELLVFRRLLYRGEGWRLAGEIGR